MHGRALMDQPPIIIRAELQINVPVEGVELEPFVLIQTPNGQSRQVLAIICNKRGIFRYL